MSSARNGRRTHPRDSPHDAEELTQESFLQVLEHNWVARADRSRGRFWSFPLMTMNRFPANATADA